MSWFDFAHRVMRRWGAATGTGRGNSLPTLMERWLDQEAPWELRHVARNLALDGKGLTMAHTDLDSCGNRLGNGALDILESLFRNLLRDCPEAGVAHNNAEAWAKAWETVDRELPKLASKARRQVEAKEIPLDTRVNRDSNRTVELVRYVSCDSVHRYWFAGSGAVREVIEKFLDEPYRMRKDSSLAEAPRPPKVNLAAEGEPVWVALGGDQAPHRVRKLREMPLKDCAIEVARRMALPGFATEGSRERGLGMIAIMYDLTEGELRIPTVLEGMQPYFYPGRQTEKHGRVASLNEDFQPPWQRDSGNSEIREWVHENKPVSDVKLAVDLVGWFID